MRTASRLVLTTRSVRPRTVRCGPFTTTGTDRTTRPSWSSVTSMSPTWNGRSSSAFEPADCARRLARARSTWSSNRRPTRGRWCSTTRTCPRAFAFVTLPLARDLSGTARGGRAARHLPGTRLRDHRHAAGERRPARRGSVRRRRRSRAAGSSACSTLRRSSSRRTERSSKPPRRQCSTSTNVFARYGFTQSEVDRAVAARRSAAQVDYDGRDSRQDASYADEYVRHVLEGESLPTADRWFDYVTEVLDRATPETLAYMFVARYEVAGPHIFVTAPADEIGDVPAAEVFVAQAEGAADREDRAASRRGCNRRLAPHPAGSGRPDRRDAARRGDGGQLPGAGAPHLRERRAGRIQHHADHGRRGGVRGPQPGRIDDARGLRRVAAAKSPRTVVENSGVGRSTRSQSMRSWRTKKWSLDATIDVFTEGLNGSAATTDMETLFQLIHLVMTEPRVDPVAPSSSTSTTNCRLPRIPRSIRTTRASSCLTESALHRSAIPAPQRRRSRTRSSRRRSKRCSATGLVTHRTGHSPSTGTSTSLKRAELARVVLSARCRRRVASSPSISPNPAARRSHRRDDTGRRGRSGQRHVPLYRGRHHSSARDDRLARLLQQSDHGPPHRRDS